MMLLVFRVPVVKAGLLKGLCPQITGTSLLQHVAYKHTVPVTRAIPKGMPVMIMSTTLIYKGGLSSRPSTRVHRLYN